MLNVIIYLSSNSKYFTQVFEFYATVYLLLSFTSLDLSDSNVLKPT